MYKNKILLLFIVTFVFFTFTGVHLVLASAINPSTPTQCTALSSTATCIIVSSPSPGCPNGRPYFDYCQSNTAGTPPEYKNCCGPVPASPATPPPATSTGGLKYTLLEKIPGLANTDGSNLPKYILALYNLALAIVVLSAVFMVSIGGFMYLTSAGNTSAMHTAKEVIFNALIGLVIALTAWLLLNVINPDLTNVSINGLSPVAVTPGAGGGVVTPPVPATGQYTHAEAVAALGGISVTSSGNCSNQNDAKCTSLNNIPKSTIANIVKLKSDSGCPFNVTGGTEVGHASHGSGLPVVDVSEAPCLKTFFQSNKANLTSGSNITKICATASNQNIAFNCTYLEPAAHFHLVFTP